jgi:hypothetical protein
MFGNGARRLGLNTVGFFAIPSVHFVHSGQDVPAMNCTLLKALVAMAPAGVLFLASIIIFVRQKRLWSVLQLLGTTGAVVVVLTHFCEALQLFPSMQWGHQHSVGYYLDLSGAILGIILIPGWVFASCAGDVACLGARAPSQYRTRT